MERDDVWREKFQENIDKVYTVGNMYGKDLKRLTFVARYIFFRLCCVFEVKRRADTKFILVKFEVLKLFSAS